VMPGVNPVNIDMYLELLEAAPTLGSVVAGSTATLTTGAPVTFSQPPLECYVFATCPPSTALTIKVTPAHAVVRRRTRLHFAVTVDVDGIVSPVPGATVLFGNGRRVQTDQNGLASASIRFGKAGRRRAIASANEYFDGTATIRVARRRGHRRAGSRRSSRS
jgi:hypothetical protein